MPNRAVIRFFAPVVDVTVNALLNAVDAKMRQGVNEIRLLISCPGGSVFHGLSAYNYLRGLPIKVVTHNFGSVDSIGVVMYCGGSERLSVPQARFLLHGVSANFAQVSLEEKQLEERLKGLKIDMANIARVIAESTGKTEEQVTKAMLDRTTLDPSQAKTWGLVHEVTSDLFEAGLEVISIQASQQKK
jgi:ATP-dependent protease ClpP protease subunit